VSLLNRIVSLPDRVQSFFDHGLWRLHRDRPLSPWKAACLRVLRIGVIAARGFVRDDCLIRAGSLTYVTIFSLVPLLAVSFAVAKGLGADDKLQEQFIEPFLDETFGRSELVDEPSLPPELQQQAAPEDEAPTAAGRQIRLVVDKVFGFVRDTNFASLGTFSFVFLLYCVVKLLGAMESALNAIWGVRSTRSFTRRLTNYLAIVVMTPMVLVTAVGVTALLEGRTYAVIQEWLGFELKLAALLVVVPFLVVSAGMTFLYLALPNTRVKLASAMLGGIVAGCLWQLSQIAHVEFQLGVARINAIYSGFAALPLFLLWLYVNWSVLLLGAEIAHAHESEPLQTTLVLTGQVDQRFRERLALRLGVRVAEAFERRESRPPSASDLASDMGLAPQLVEQVLGQLTEGKIVVRTDEDSGQGYLPARNPSTITLVQVLEAVRREPQASPPPVVRRCDEGVDRTLFAMEEELARSAHNKSLATLARAFAEEPAPEGEMRAAELPTG
jgi:membrane protein